MNFYHELYKGLPEITIGNRIQKSRIIKGMSQQELAERCGLKRGAINTFEYDLAYPSISSMKAIALALDMPFQHFEDEYYSFVNDGFSGRLKRWRKENGLSMRAAAQKLGVDVTTLNSWEQERYVMNRITFNRCIKIIEGA